ncbi:MAG: DNA polymerase sliding clamp [Acidilobaceae archaeon]|nr:DNA polymerase sliding clamp [Acidilobaceae archaeon]MCX8165552.1 DNA polymerase sliding clamp [Acidilobaceae archaeon]MDW7973979.1 DNA polymerase sliding clamp [Sulfolobales archaeon]
MRVHFKDASVWLGIVASIEKVIDEGVFVVDSEGISLRALDVSHVAMIDLRFPSSSFSEFHVEGREEVGVSFGVLSKVLRRAVKGNELALATEGGSLIVEFLGKGRRTFKIPQVSLTYEKLPEPRITFTVKAKMLGTAFAEVVRAIAPVADVLELQASEDRLVFVGEGDLVKRAEVELVSGSHVLLELDVESSDRSKYSTEYFTYLIPASRYADTVTLRYAEDAPVRIDLEHAGGGRLTLYVSPRAE